MIRDIIDKKRKVLIGVVHLPSLRRALIEGRDAIERVLEIAIDDCRKLEEAGFDGIIVENYNDAPYLVRERDLGILSLINLAVRECINSTSIPVGLNILRNSAIESYIIAYVSGAKFIRVNAFVEVLITDSGIIEPAAPSLSILRAHYPGVEVFADILCKHSASLYFAYLSHLTNYDNALRTIVRDAIERGKADALIVTGSRTGEPPSTSLLQSVKRYSLIPILIGSGLTPENANVLLKVADGAIVGSYIKIGGKAGGRVDIERAQKLVKLIRAIFT